jgi:hypothetical protein
MPKRISLSVTPLTAKARGGANAAVVVACGTLAFAGAGALGAAAAATITGAVGAALPGRSSGAAGGAGGVTMTV